jgi:hypothetical protein
MEAFREREAGQVNWDTRDLDHFIGERIMGFPVSLNTMSHVTPSVPRFSTEEVAAAVYLSRIEQLGAKLTVEALPLPFSEANIYWAACEFDDQKRIFSHERRPLAIAMAVCAAFGFEPLKQKPAPDSQWIIAMKAPAC